MSPSDGLSETQFPSRRVREAEWRRYLLELAIANTFLGRPVLTDVDWRRKP